MNPSRPAFGFALLLALAGCAVRPVPEYPRIGQLTTYDSAFSAVIDPDARIEQIADGLAWAEGPTWVQQGGYLLFTDVPQNTLYRWSEDAGLSVLLKPSGYAGPGLDTLREAGANGLFAEATGTVLLADSGSRAVFRLDPRSGQKTELASQYNGQRFNSPNDLVRDAAGRIYFTDPPFGLKGMNDSPAKQLRYNGVYRLDTDGTVTLLDDQLSYPNGVALSPDQRTLYVSNTEGAMPLWIAYTLDDNGAVQQRRVFDDATDLMGTDSPGLPDGMAVAADGTLFFTAPGGVIVFTPAGKRLGRIETGGPVSNCAFGDDGYTLYLSSAQHIARVRLKIRGAGFSRAAAPSDRH